MAPKSRDGVSAPTRTLGPTTLIDCADGSYSALYILGLGNGELRDRDDQLTITLTDQGRSCTNRAQGLGADNALQGSDRLDQH